MIRTLDAAGYIMWLYVKPSTAERPPFDAVCFIDIVDGVPWIRGLSGRFYPRFVREMAEWFSARGYATVRAARADGHVLPGAFLMPEGYFEWCTADIMKRYACAPLKKQPADTPPAWT